MENIINEFSAEKINKSLDAYEKEQGGKINYGDDEGMLYVYSHINTDEDLAYGHIAFDTVSGVTQQGGQDTTMATVFSNVLGHSLILSWECPTSFKDRNEFIAFLKGLHEDAVSALKKIGK